MARAGWHYIGLSGRSSAFGDVGWPSRAPFQARFSTSGAAGHHIMALWHQQPGIVSEPFIRECVHCFYAIPAIELIVDEILD